MIVSRVSCALCYSIQKALPSGEEKLETARKMKGFGDSTEKICATTCLSSETIKRL